MRQSLILVALLASHLSLFASQYTYYQTYTGSSSGFTQNGTLTSLSTPYGSGVTSSTSDGGSLISSMAVPDGSVHYEAAMTLGIAHSGVTYTMYLLASPNSLAGSSTTTGAYYTVVLTPTLAANGSCSANLVVYERVHGTVSLVVSGTIPCRNGMTLHAVTCQNGQLQVYGDNTSFGPMFIESVPYQSGGAIQSDGTPKNPTGTAGFGISGASAGSTTDYIANLRVGPLDTVNPNPVPSSNAYVQSNRVDIHAAGATDDANGIGIGVYYLFRNGTYMEEAPTPDFADTTVQAGTAYQYTIFSADFHNNLGTGVNLAVTTLASGAVEPRETGLRPTGTYWGGAGEQIDTLFGNLNYSFPLVAAQGRGWSVPLTLSYNSQNWVQDAGGNNWQFGTDNGFGYGWNLQIGVLRKYALSNGWTPDYFEFRDSSGAVYRLNQNNSGIWSSVESTYVWYDSNANIMHFANGNFWVLGCMSSLGEPDAGDLYPTIIEDSNGNQVTIAYDSGVGATWANSSGRIVNVTDVRGSAYSLTYANISGGYALRYLTQITNNLSTGESFSLSYSSPAQLQSPISGSYRAETTVFLTGIVNNATNLGTQFAYDPSGSGELNKVTFPYGGYFRWAYGNQTYAANRTTREVTSRYLLWDSGIGERTFTFSRDGGDSSRNLPLYRQVTDSHANALKAWYANASGSSQGLIATFNESSVSPQTILRQTAYTWAQDSASNNYIASVQQTTDPASSTPATKRTDQVLDTYGNVTQSSLYTYSNLTSAAKVYKNTYLSGANYSSNYIYNRLLSSTVTAGSTTLTTVTNSYDAAAPADSPGVTQHDTNYGTGFLCRGNLTSSVSFGTTQQSTYDITGTVVTSSDSNPKHAVTVTTGTATNYAAPTALTTANSLTTSMGYDAQLNTTSGQNPNGAVASSVYDSASRPSSSTSPYGGVTTYSYSTSAPQVTATTGNQWTQTYYDGLGRTKRVATGYSSTTTSYTDTVYDTCGCTPVGKPYQSSLPYAPGATAAWKVNTYDAIGRTLTTVAPDGASKTSYSYAGSVLTVTDPAGKWKQYVTDSFGELTQVTEPSPNSGSEPNHVTSYIYDVLGHLIQVQMPRTVSGSVVTQTRSWVYNQATQFLTSNTMPESGTTSYTYNSDGSVATKTDAKNQQIQYTYDPYGRLIQVSRGVLANGGFTENVAQRTTMTYDGTNGGFSSNTAGLLSGVSYTGPHGLLFNEFYSYHAAGAVTAKRLSTAIPPAGSSSSSSSSGSSSSSSSSTAGCSTSSSSSSAASYCGLDRITQGTWTSSYGHDGYMIANDATSLPSYAAASVTGASTYTWESPSSDPRSLQTAPGSAAQIAATYAGSSFSFAVNLTDGNMHRVSLYLLDFDNSSRSETVSVVDAATNAVLDTETFSNMTNGIYASWNIKGNVMIQVSQTSAARAVVAGVFFDPAATRPIIPPASSAAYGSPDTTTQGMWTSLYGTDGYMIANDATSLPSYAAASVTGSSPYTWQSPSSDPRALQTAPNSATQIASAYAGNSFNIPVKFTDGNMHRVSLYLLDFDNSSRSEFVSIVDVATSTVLDTETFSNMTSGVYASWNIKGNVVIQVTQTSNPHAVVAGVFFDPASAAIPPSASTTAGYFTANLDATYSYNSLGQVTSVQYPLASWSASAAATAGPQYSYTYDAMNRLNGMTGPNSQTLVSGVTYGAANQVLQLNAASFTEVRSYNANLQLIELTSGANVHYQYNYSATQNNGRILSQTDVVSGESVTYAYDTLNRLTGASGAVSGSNTSWSQAFTYDGYGNLTQKSGSNAPNNMLLTADPATNRLTGNGAGYDANGNLSANGTGSYAVSYSYDMENRMSAAGSGGVTQAVFGYDQGNQRVYQGTYNTSTGAYSNEQIYFYGADGKKLAVYSLAASGSSYTLTASQTKVWFGGRILAPEDRLESQGKYFPYGEDRYSPSPANPGNDTEKFATYTRDASTGLDYAYQRYYNSQVGRFHTADPYAGSGQPADPQSWNRYGYALSDPANLNDPQGLCSPGISFCITHTDPDFAINNLLYSGWQSALQFLNQTPSNGGGASTKASPATVVHVTDLTKSGAKYAVVKSRLQAIEQNIDPKCKAFLQSGGQSVTQYISDLLSANLLAVATFQTNIAAFTNTAGTDIPAGTAAVVVNSVSSFFTGGSTVDNGKLTGGTVQAQTFILLHELGHALGAKGFKSDFNDSTAGSSNDQLIQQNCSKTIGK